MISARLGDLVIDPVALAQFMRSPAGPVLRDLERRGTNVQIRARQLVRKRTRRLEKSIVKRPGVDAKGPFVLVLTEGVEYALHEHDGTRPHVIRPKARRMLRFPAGGGVVFARSVSHPGTTGTKYLLRAMQEEAAR
jgi:hypothetical protein